MSSKTISTIFTYFYVNHDICIYSKMQDKYFNEKCNYNIRFSCLANHTKLKRSLQFVSQNIDPDNISWFANYLLAFDKYDSIHTSDELLQRLHDNELITLYVNDDYEYKNEFLTVYNNIKQEFKQ